MGPASVAAAVDVLGAQRIGHGVRAIEDDALLARLVDSEVMLCPPSSTSSTITMTWIDTTCAPHNSVLCSTRTHRMWFDDDR